jgi:hypothetical protein
MFILKQLCPIGFVAPDDPLRGGVDWVPGTGCAAECPRPMFTHAEYDAVSTTSQTHTDLYVVLAYIV